MTTRYSLRDPNRGALSATALATIIATCFALGGCSSADEVPAVADPPTAPPAGPSYHRDVKAIVDQKCVGCHTGGGIAPFALTTFAEVSAYKEAIAAAVGSGAMPPWPPEKSCAEYHGDRSLSAEQTATLTGWIAEGAREGDPKEAPPASEPVDALSRVDVTLAMPEAYTPELRPDDYRCFLVDWPEPETTYVTGFGVIPGTPAIVHHVIAFLAKPDQIADYQALDEAEPGPGYQCFGGPGGGGASSLSQGSGWVGAWAPGARGSDFPPGTGIEIPPGSKVVIQVHYNTLIADPTPDVTKLLIKTDKTVEKKAAVMPFADPSWVTNQTMVIPAHTADAKASISFDPTRFMRFMSAGVVPDNTSFTVYAAALHMHTRGSNAVTRIKRKDGGDECMLQIDEWNFHWQGSYGFVEPKRVNPGDQISLECHWNNPGATDINWGEGTGDEMCLGTFYVTE